MSGIPLSLFEPAGEGGVAFGRAESGEEAFDTDVLVEIGPVSPLAVADQFVLFSFWFRSVQQSGIPS